MSSKKRSGSDDRRPADKAVAASSRPKPALPADGRARFALLVAVLVLAAAVVIGADFVFGAVSNGGGNGAPAATPAATSSQIGVVVQGRGGNWTNVSPDQLAQMMTHKNFVLVNVKTPYIGEIDGTDLYIPYDQLVARASALPAKKGFQILVYCRSGVESAQAAQTLLDLGYTNVWNLDGGMNAWQASGRTLIQKSR
jgi:rhodanese-related sulfurtransferase